MFSTVLVIVSIVIAAACAMYAWRLRAAERLRSAARIDALAAAIEGTAVDATAPATPMFGRDPRSVVHGRPLLKLAFGFVAAVAIIVAIAMSGDRREPVAASAAGTESSLQALELLSMRHQREGNSLTVTGLVRNPASEAPGAIMAVVFAFDRDGGFLASGRAPLEFATIAGGDESPFRVTIPDAGDVGRYRVSFRTTAGVVRHVDRRDVKPAAISVQRSGVAGRGLRLAAPAAAANPFS